MLEIRGEIESFTNQMLYNVCLCEMTLGKAEDAKNTVQKMKIPL